MARKRKEPPEPATLVAARVKALRNAHGWSQEQLAERVEIHQTAIAKIESEDRRVTVDELFALAAALDASPLALLVNDEDAVVKIGNGRHSHDVQAPTLWAWITMREPLGFQDGDAFRQAHGLARRLEELDRQEQRSRLVERLTEFLADYADIPPEVKGGIRAQLYNAAHARLPGGSDDIVESALFGETTEEG